jgi:hypothetical protein
MPHVAAQNPKERKAMFLRKLSSVFKIAAWGIPGSAKRAAFEEFLNPFFKSMEETEAAWEKIPESMKVSLSFVPLGTTTNSDIYKEISTNHAIQTSNEPPRSDCIVLGTTGFGIRCIFRAHIQSASPDIILPAKVLSEAKIWHIFVVQEEQSPGTLSSQNVILRGDGRDP